MKDFVKSISKEILILIKAQFAAIEFYCAEIILQFDINI
jgi:hypothetical protein